MPDLGDRRHHRQTAGRVVQQGPDLREEWRFALHRRLQVNWPADMQTLVSHSPNKRGVFFVRFVSLRRPIVNKPFRDADNRFDVRGFIESCDARCWSVRSGDRRAARLGTVDGRTLNRLGRSMKRGITRCASPAVESPRVKVLAHGEPVRSGNPRAGGKHSGADRRNPVAPAGLGCAIPAGHRRS
jgi:hypothetical protein